MLVDCAFRLVKEGIDEFWVVGFGFRFARGFALLMWLGGIGWSRAE